MTRHNLRMLLVMAGLAGALAAILWLAVNHPFALVGGLSMLAFCVILVVVWCIASEFVTDWERRK